MNIKKFEQLHQLLHNIQNSTGPGAYPQPRSCLKTGATIGTILTDVSPKLAFKLSRLEMLQLPYWVIPLLTKSLPLKSFSVSVQILWCDLNSCSTHT